MPYTPQLPPCTTDREVRDHLSVGSPIPKKPVTPVTAVTRFLSMNLREFEEQGRPLEVRVPRLPETVWFVPGECEVETLAQRGISRGRVWTARELRALWFGGVPAQDGAQSLARVKIALDADVVSIENLEAKEESSDGALG